MHVQVGKALLLLLEVVLGEGCNAWQGRGRSLPVTAKPRQPANEGGRGKILLLPPLSFGKPRLIMQSEFFFVTCQVDWRWLVNLFSVYAADEGPLLTVAFGLN